MEAMPSSLVQIANQVIRVVIPTILITGVLSNSLDIIVLTRPSLYQHACSRYLLAHAGGNLFYLTVVLVYRFLVDQYYIDPARNSMVLCKIFTYITHVGIFLAPNFIVLASIDRWCASSSHPRLHNFSSVKLARRMILLIIILFALFFINSAVLVDVRDSDSFGCSIRADTVYKRMYAFIQVALVSFIPPFLMALFGLMTIYNMKRARILPARNTIYRRTGRQLCYMLLVQVVCHILLNLPTSVTYLIFNLSTDLKTTNGFVFASLISFVPFHLSYTTAFFLYILSSQVYRRELFLLKNKVFGHRANIQVHPIINTNTARTIIH